MKRREFIRLLGGAAAAWPGVAQGQQPMLPVIGYLHSRSPETEGSSLTGFRQGLREAGYVEGQNVAIEYRWAAGQFSKLPELAADLVRRRVTVLAALGGNNSTLAAKSATTSIPIVFVSGADPVRTGIVTSLNRPGGNITGISFFVAELAAKGLGLLRELVPAANVVGLIINPNSPESRGLANDVETSTRPLGLKLVIVNASTEGELHAGFLALVEQRAGSVIVSGDPFFGGQIEQIVGLAAQHRIPAVYYRREFAAAGGLMSYGTSIADAYRQAGIYTGRILRGDKPGDLPVMQSVKFELVINLKAAKALGLSVPNSMQMLADEVIE